MDTQRLINLDYSLKEYTITKLVISDTNSFKFFEKYLLDNGWVWTSGSKKSILLRNKNINKIHNIKLILNADNKKIKFRTNVCLDDYSDDKIFNFTKGDILNLNSLLKHNKVISYKSKEMSK